MSRKLSIIMPGIRSEHWVRVYNEISRSCSRHDFELIISSYKSLPDELSVKSNVKFVYDAGCPSRCLQHASTFAEGEYISIISDDCIVLQNSISDCIDQLERSELPDRNIIALRYTEGQGYRANPSDFDHKYWSAKYHGDLRIQGIEDNWMICLMFLMKTDMFKWLGGIDCRFEHFNMNLHDMAFRAQRSGSRVITSDGFVTAHDWEPVRNISSSPIIQAYHLNDKPLFDSIYQHRETSQSRPIRIDYDNWKMTPEVWPRRNSVN